MPTPELLLSALQGFAMGGGLIIAIGAQNAFVLKMGLLRRHLLPVVLFCFLSDAALIAAGVGGFGSLVAAFPLLTDAAAKVYLTASVTERARRRHLEFSERGNVIGYEQVLQELQRRDAIDSERDDSPLRPADDAVVIETDGRPIEDLAKEIVALVRAR